MVTGWFQPWKRTLQIMWNTPQHRRESHWTRSLFVIMTGSFKQICLKWCMMGSPGCLLVFVCFSLLHHCNWPRWNWLLKRALDLWHKHQLLTNAVTPSLCHWSAYKHMCLPFVKQAGREGEALLLHPQLSVSFQEVICYNSAKQGTFSCFLVSRVVFLVKNGIWDTLCPKWMSQSQNVQWKWFEWSLK